MNEWPLVPLGEVAYLDVETADVEDTVEYPIVGVLNRGRGLLVREPIRGSETAYKTFNVVRENRIVFSRLKAFEGAITVVPAGSGMAYASQEFPTFTCGPDLVPDFFRMLTTTPGLWATLQNLSTGMGGRRERVKPSAFLTIEVRLPSVDEQRRIVAVMSAVDAQIEALEIETGHLSDFRAASIASVLDATSESCTIGDYAKVSQGRSLPRTVQDQATGDVPWFKIADMAKPPNVFGYEVAATRLSAPEIAKLGGTIECRNSVVFPRVGAAVLTEKKRILDVDGAVDENHLVLTPKSGTDPESLLGLMEHFRLASLTQTGAVPSLNMSLVRAASVPLLGEEDQRRLGASLATMRAFGRAFASELAALRAVRTDLLSALLSQQITADDAVDQFVKVAA